MSLDDLHDSTAAQAYAHRRAGLSQDLPGFRLQELDAQLLWWYVRELFEQHPVVAAFTPRPGDDNNETQEGDDSLPQAVSMVLDIQPTPGTDPADPALQRAGEAFTQLLGRYESIDPTALDFVFMAGTCHRDRMEEWDWGSAGEAWQAWLRAQAMDRGLPPGTDKPAPGPRL